MGFCPPKSLFVLKAFHDGHLAGTSTGWAISTWPPPHSVIVHNRQHTEATRGQRWQMGIDRTVYTWRQLSVSSKRGRILKCDDMGEPRVQHAEGNEPQSKHVSPLLCGTHGSDTDRCRLQYSKRWENRVAMGVGFQLSRMRVAGTLLLTQRDGYTVCIRQSLKGLQ